MFCGIINVSNEREVVIMSWSVGENTYPVSKSIKDINYEEEKMHEYNRGYFDPIYSEIHEIKVAKPLESYEEESTTQ